MIELRQLIQIVWKWKTSILLATAIAGLIALIVTYNLESRYRVKTTLMVGNFLDRSPVSESVLRIRRELARNYAHLAGQHRFLQDFVLQTGLDLNVDRISAQLSVRPLQETQMLEVSFVDTDYSRACRIADKFAVWLRDFNFDSNDKTESLSIIQSEIDGLESDMREARSQLTILRRNQSGESDLDEESQNKILQLENRLQVLRSDYLRFVDNLNSADRISILGPSSGSRTPVYPSLWLNLIATVFGVFVLSLIVIILIEYPLPDHTSERTSEG